MEPKDEKSADSASELSQEASVTENPLPDPLPPVEPPSTSFFVQLFLLPALIVVGVMAVWFLFGKLAGERSVEELVEVLKSDRKDRWKQAHDLSYLLRENSRYTKDAALALTLATEFQASLDASSNRDEQLLEYLAGALGCFELPTGVPLLRRAAREEQSIRVRRAALIALARLADRLDGNLDDPSVMYELQDHLQDPDPEIRELAAFTLGFVGSERVAPALVACLDDPKRTVRYNAAAALGAIGSDQGLPVIKEMLDPDELSLHLRTVEDSQIVDEPLVVATALAALHSLAKLQKLQPDVNLAPVEQPLHDLAESSNDMLRNAAKQVLLGMSNSKGN